MKKFISLIVICTMLLSLSLPAFATNSVTQTAENEENSTALEPYVLYTADDGVPPKTEFTEFNANDVMTTKEGKKAFKWGPGLEAFSDAGEIRLRFADIKTADNKTEDTVITDYKDLVIEVYSATDNFNAFDLRLKAIGLENTASKGGGFYYQSWKTNWKGGWKEIRIPLSGGPEVAVPSNGYLDDIGDWNINGTPDYTLHQANQLTISTAYTRNFYEDTEVYIHKVYFDGERKSNTANANGELIWDDHYDPETMTDYVAMVKEKHPDKSHPRLFVTDEIFERINTYKSTDTHMKNFYNRVKEKADKYLDTECTSAIYSNDVGTSYQFNRTIEEVAQYCGMMYLLTDDADKKAEYAERIWKEIVNIANAEKLWSSIGTGLDCAHISNGMALAYDWCYDYWTKEQKLFIRNALMTHAFNFALTCRNGVGWMNSRNNVTVADSKGFMTAALAICDEAGYENICNELMNYIVEYLPLNFMYQIEPDGGYAEGLGYWEYAIYNYVTMLEAMMTAIGTDEGVMNSPAFKKTCQFPFAMRGPMGAFNHSDSIKTHLQEGSPMYHLLAERYEIPAFRSYRLEAYQKHGGIEIADLIWYDPNVEASSDSWSEGLSNDYFIGGLEPMTSLRSGYGDRANYIAAKGGNSKTGHDQYDAGTFVLDALGVRWIENLGSGIYGITSLPEWYYYFERAEAHNCIVFEPEMWSDGSGQTVALNAHDTIGPIVDSGATSGAAFTVFDVNPSYKETTKAYKRGFALINNRTQFIVRDEFETTEPFELYSYFHTLKENEIIINSDGKSLIMENKESGEMCKVDFITDIPNFEIGVMEAEKHPASPVIPSDGNHVPDRDYSTFHKFYLHADDVEKASITVVFTPLTKNTSVTVPEIKPLASWDDYAQGSNDATIYDIDINSIDDNKVTITTNGTLTGEKTLILASYSGTRLVGVKAVPVEFEKGTKSYTVTGFDAGNGNIIKAFVWDDMLSTRPLSKPQSK